MAPEDAGLAGQALDAAVSYAVAHEIPWPNDLSLTNVSNDPPEHAEKLGPLKERGGPAGLVLRDGEIVAEWGDAGRVDVTFSTTKSYLATVAGLAVDRGLISSVDDRVIDYFSAADIRDARTDEPLRPFDGPHNSGVTWRHLLQQTSEWEGTLWDKPDTVDWNRSLADVSAGKRDARKAPGEHWEYNDVRVNLLALSLLAIWKEPLPAVLKREVMDPIGASPGWEWHGYHNSWVTLDGTRAQSVSGGAHWGGGIWISTYDHARFGLLFLNEGVWEGRRLISESWLDEMRMPCARAGDYGYMWWLDTGSKRYGPDVPDCVFAASGAGGNSVVIDPENRLVIVTRWCDDVPGVVQRVVRAVTRP